MNDSESIDGKPGAGVPPSRILELGNAHHNWVKKWVAAKPMKCLTCMADLPLYCFAAECYSNYSRFMMFQMQIRYVSACKIVIHHQCAGSLRNTCGQSVFMTCEEYLAHESDLYKQHDTLHFCGWLKIWRFLAYLLENNRKISVNIFDEYFKLRRTKLAMFMDLYSRSHAGIFQN